MKLDLYDDNSLLIYFLSNFLTEVTSSVLECDCCRQTEIADKIVQCCDCHLVCSKCVEKQVKVILAPDNKEVGGLKLV